MAQDPEEPFAPTTLPPTGQPPPRQMTYPDFASLLYEVFPGRYDQEDPSDLVEAALKVWPQFQADLDPTSKGVEWLFDYSKVKASLKDRQPPPHPMMYDPRAGTWGEQALAMALRIVPGIAGGMAGAAIGGIPGAAAGGGAGSGYGELMAQSFEERLGMRHEGSLGVVAAQTALGAIPLGPLAQRTAGHLVTRYAYPEALKRVLEVTASTTAAPRMARSMTEGAVLGTGSVTSSALIEAGRWPTVGEVAKGAGYGAAFGLGLEGLQIGGEKYAQHSRDTRAATPIGAAARAINTPGTTAHVAKQTVLDLVQTLQAQGVSPDRIKQAFDDLQPIVEDLRAAEVQSYAAAWIKEFQDEAPGMDIAGRVAKAEEFMAEMEAMEAGAAVLEQVRATAADAMLHPPPIPPLRLPAQAGPDAVPGRVFTQEASGVQMVSPLPPVGAPPGTVLPPTIPLRSSPGEEGPAYPGAGVTPLPPGTVTNWPEGRAQVAVPRDQWPPGWEARVPGYEPPPPPPPVPPEPPQTLLAGEAAVPPTGPTQLVLPVRKPPRLKGALSPRELPPGPLRLPEARPVSPRVTKGEITPRQAFILHWMASELEDVQFQAGERSPDLPDAHYDPNVPATQATRSFEAINQTPGTPIYHMLDAFGMTGNYTEKAGRIREYLAGKGRQSAGRQGMIDLAVFYDQALDPRTGKLDLSRIDRARFPRERMDRVANVVQIGRGKRFSPRGSYEALAGPISPPDYYLHVNDPEDLIAYFAPDVDRSRLQGAPNPDAPPAAGEPPTTAPDYVQPLGDPVGAPPPEAQAELAAYSPETIRGLLEENPDLTIASWLRWELERRGGELQQPSLISHAMGASGGIPVTRLLAEGMEPPQAPPDRPGAGGGGDAATANVRRQRAVEADQRQQAAWRALFDAPAAQRPGLVGKLSREDAAALLERAEALQRDLGNMDPAVLTALREQARPAQAPLPQERRGAPDLFGRVEEPPAPPAAPALAPGTRVRVQVGTYKNPRTVEGEVVKVHRAKGEVIGAQIAYDALGGGRVTTTRGMKDLEVVGAEAAPAPPGPPAQGRRPFPHDRWKDLPAEAEYLYHATNLDNVEGVVEGALEPRGPAFGTEQDAWPDGGVEDRVYFTPTPKTAWQFAPAEGKPALLRVRRDRGSFQAERGTGDWFSRKAIRAGDVEFLNEQGQWVPLGEQDVPLLPEVRGEERPTPEIAEAPFSLEAPVSQAAPVQASLGLGGPPSFPKQPVVGKRPKGSTSGPSLFDETGMAGGSIPRSPKAARTVRDFQLHGTTLARLQRVVASKPGEEVVGFLLGTPDGVILDVQQVANQSPTPATQFFVSAAQMSGVLTRAQRMGLEVLGTFHSHPGGAAGATKLDMQGSVADYPILILGTDKAGQIGDARVWQPGKNRQFQAGSLRVGDDVATSPPPPGPTPTLRHFGQLLRQVPPPAPPKGDLPALTSFLAQGEKDFGGEAWFQRAKLLYAQDKPESAWLLIQAQRKVMLAEAARLGQALPKPEMQQAAQDLIAKVTRGTAEDPTGLLWALFDGRTASVEGAGRIVVPPTLPPESAGKGVTVGKGGLLNPPAWHGKVPKDYHEAVMTLGSVNEILKHGEYGDFAALIDPSKPEGLRLYQQVGEHIMLHPAIAAAMKNGALDPVELASLMEKTVQHSARVLNALKQFQDRLKADERVVQIVGTFGAKDPEDIMLYGPKGRKLGTFGDLERSLDPAFVRQVHQANAWSRAMLLADITKAEPVPIFAGIERSTRGFMLSQFATAMRDLQQAHLRWDLGLLEDGIEGLAHAVSGNRTAATAKFQRAREDGTAFRNLRWVNPWTQARKEDLPGIFGYTEDMLHTLPADDIRRYVALIEDFPEDAAHFVGSWNFDAAGPGETASPTVNWLLSPKVQNTLTMSKRAAEFPIKAVVYTNAFREQLRLAGLDPNAVMAPTGNFRADVNSIVEAVGGPEAYHGMVQRAIGEALDFTYAGPAMPDSETANLIRIIGGSGPIATLIRTGFPWVAFNLSRAPKFFMDRFVLGAFLDVARVLFRSKHGRLAVGLQGGDAAIQEANQTRLIAQRESELTQAFVDRATAELQFRVQGKLTTRALKSWREAQAAERAGTMLPGDAQVRHDAYQYLVEQQSQVEAGMKLAQQRTTALAKEIHAATELRTKFRETRKKAAETGAPTSWQEFAARHLVGVGLLGTAIAIRSTPWAEGTRWYELKVPDEVVDALGPEWAQEHLQRQDNAFLIDFRPFAGLVQFLFVGDLLKDLAEHTDWPAIAQAHPAAASIPLVGTGAAAAVEFWTDSLSKHYEGKYDPATILYEVGNAFLSFSQAAGTTLALGAFFARHQPVTWDAAAQLGSQILGEFAARYAIPVGGYLRPLYNMFDPEESLVRVAGQPGEPGTGLGAILEQIPEASQLIPPIYDELSGDPIRSQAMGLRALTGVGIRTRERIAQEILDIGLPRQTWALGKIGDRYLDDRVTMEYAALVQQVIPEILDDPAYASLPSPALKRDFLQGQIGTPNIFAQLKRVAILTVAGEVGYDEIQRARETPEQERRRLRFERLMSEVEALGIPPEPDPDALQPPGPPPPQ